MAVYNGGFTLRPVDDPLDVRTALQLGMHMTRSSKRPILSGTVDSTSAIAGKHGAFYFGAKLAPLQFGLDCAMFMSNPIELQAAADRLAEFILDSSGSPRQLELVFDIKPGKKYLVYYSGSLDIGRVVGFGEFVLPLIAYDPFSYQTDLSNTLTWDSEVLMVNDLLTFDDGFDFIIAGTQTVEVVNYGALEIWPTIKIVGSFITLYIKLGDRTLVYGESVASGTVTIDNERMQAKLAATNKNNKVSGRWIKLAPGRNNVEIGGTGLNCSVSFVFAAKYT
ncbi:phage tail domain-containing protein [Bacillus sp. FJAT-28004]|uniref:phage tail domain-containing protein n=1 Tax=Bacillus sp. FJAT-28004 TaxID=1679165 RepID=UPI0006B43FF8|nr:phage tail domain-containing protein [Bacillus sp. FJAT-28004]